MKKNNIYLLLVISILFMLFIYFNYKEGFRSPPSNNIPTVNKGEWNMDPNDTDPWWNEHKTMTGPDISLNALYNAVEWNHHEYTKGYRTGYDVSFNNLSSYRRPENEEEDSEPTGQTCESLKCIADFGTNVGDDLCCGQSGVLQNTKYVCPSSKPTCKNFKCGSKFGKCY